MKLTCEDVMSENYLKCNADMDILTHKNYLIMAYEAKKRYRSYRIIYVQTDRNQENGVNKKK